MTRSLLHLALMAAILLSPAVLSAGSDTTLFSWLLAMKPISKEGGVRKLGSWTCNYTAASIDASSNQNVLTEQRTLSCTNKSGSAVQTVIGCSRAIDPNKGHFYPFLPKEAMLQLKHKDEQPQTMMLVCGEYEPIRRN